MTYNAIILFKSNTAFVLGNFHIVMKMSFAKEISANLGYFIVGCYMILPRSEGLRVVK